MSLPLSFGVAHPSSHLIGPASTRSEAFCTNSHCATARIERRDANRCVMSEFPTASNLCRSGAVLRCPGHCNWRLEAASLRQELQQQEGLRDRSSVCIYSGKKHGFQYRRKLNNSSRAIRVACIEKRSQLFWCDRGLPAGMNYCFSARMDSLYRHDKLRSSTVSSSKRQISISTTGALLLGSRSSVATAANKRIAAERRDDIAETSSVSREGNLGFQEANLSVRSGLKIGGFEESKASPEENSRAELQLSSNEENKNLEKSDERLSTSECPVDGSSGFKKVKLQFDGKVEEISHWWKVLHKVYREDTTAWGFGTNPIFTVYEGPGGRIERVSIDEKEIQRRAGVEPLLSGYADEASKALAQQRIELARGIANDIEIGNKQPKKSSTIFKVVKPTNKHESQNKHEKIFSQIDSFAHTAAPVLKTAFLVAMPIYGFCVLWGASILLSKRHQKDIIKDEESAARFDKIRNVKALIDRRDDSKGQDINASMQLPADTSAFVQKLEEVREMARQLGAGGNKLQTSVESDVPEDFITVGENQLGSLHLKPSTEGGAGTNVVDIETQVQVSMDMNNMEEMNKDYSSGKVYDKDIRKVQASDLEDGSNILKGDLKSASVIAQREKIVGNDGFQASGFIEKGNSGKSPSKLSLGVKPRIIMSPEEARITVAGSRTRATSTNTQHSSSSASQNVETRKTRPRTKNGKNVKDNIVSPRIERDLVGSLSANDDIYNGHGLNTRLNESSSSVQSGYYNGGADLMQQNHDQTLGLQNEGKSKGGKKQKGGERLVSNVSETENEVAKFGEEEEPVWMRNKALREVVFKVQENEEAGREPFFGLGSEEEKLFFEGITKRIKMEEDRATKLGEDRAENGRYGLDGIGIDDPSYWKDLKKAGPLLNKLMEEKQKQLREQQRFKPSLSSSTVKVSGGVQPAELAETQEKRGTNKFASYHREPAVVGSGQPLRNQETFKNSKRWGKELQKKFDSERDPEMRELMKEIGSDLDKWVTEEEVEEAGRLALKLEQGEEEYVHQHFKSVEEKIKQQKERFGLEAVLNKYKEYQPAPEDALWWLDLHCVLCLKVISKAEREGGLYSLDMSLDIEGASNQQAKHVIGFQERKDVMSFCYLLQNESESKFAHVEVCPFSPKQLYEIAKMEDFKVTVLKQGQICINVGQTLDEVEEKILELGRTVYLEHLENERSIDVDSILDQGFGL